MKNKIKDRTDEKQSLLYFSLLKQYYGQTWSASKNNGQGGYRKKVLYNEREWRFVPRTLKVDDMVLKVKDYDDLIDRPTNIAVKKVELSFTISDINFIIIDSENERLPLITHIITIFGDTDEARKLCSKILSIKQIKENF